MCWFCYYPSLIHFLMRLLGDLLYINILANSRCNECNTTHLPNHLKNLLSAEFYILFMLFSSHQFIPVIYTSLNSLIYCLFVYDMSKQSNYSQQPTTPYNPMPSLSHQQHIPVVCSHLKWCYNLSGSVATWIPSGTSSMFWPFMCTHSLKRWGRSLHCNQIIQGPKQLGLY